MSARTGREIVDLMVPVCLRILVDAVVRHVVFSLTEAWSGTKKSRDGVGKSPMGGFRLGVPSRYEYYQRKIGRCNRILLYHGSRYPFATSFKMCSPFHSLPLRF